MRKRPAPKPVVSPTQPLPSSLQGLAPRPAGMSAAVARAVNLATWWAEGHKQPKEIANG